MIQLSVEIEELEEIKVRLKNIMENSFPAGKPELPNVEED